jgi:hypothetical protein
MRRFALALVAALVPAALLPAAPARASEPVPREVSGCVSGGVLRAEGYAFTVRVTAAGRWRDVDLRAFEGMTIRVGGALLPGDVLVMQRLDVVAADCRGDGK